jgi:hypothetical protein
MINFVVSFQQLFKICAIVISILYLGNWFLEVWYLSHAAKPTLTDRRAALNLSNNIP